MKKHSVKVVYFFMSNGAAPTGSMHNTWKLPQKCGEQYNNFAGEGTFKLLNKLHQDGIINDLRVFYESNRDPGKASWIPGVYCAVVPEIKYAARFIRKDTIIFVRGGFRGWHNFLVEYKNKNWLVLYAANTGRQRWNWWDVILNDCQRTNHIDNYHRYWNFYIKPTDEDIFYPKQMKSKYDLCIGASNVHDKKGQWRVINMLVRYKRLFNKNLRCILPGAFRRSINTNKIHDIIAQHDLNVEIAGKVTRDQLCDIFNQSKYFIHLGTHGQNDRGPIEAFACGTPLIIGSPKYHSPILYENSNVTYVPEELDNCDKIAEHIRLLINSYTAEKRDLVHSYYRENYSFDICYQRMQFLFKLLSQNKINLQTKVNLSKYYSSIQP